jgi:uncharacterized protein (TIGR03435 family)
MRNRELLALGIFNSASRLGDRIELLLRRGRTFSARVSYARVAVSCAALLGSVIAFAQLPELPGFDVASVKPNKSGGAGGVRTTPGRIVGINTTAKMLIREAFNVRSYQISGGPGWLESDRFDLEAKAMGNASEDQLRHMLQRLLAERFKLAMHRDAKEMQVSVITVAKSGFKLHELKPGELGPVRTPPKERVAGMIFRTGSISDLADLLSGPMRRPVLDRTGLKGNYVVDIAWGAGEDVFTAFQDQLGLEFESQKAQTEILIIDHIEKPDPN